MALASGMRGKSSYVIAPSMPDGTASADAWTESAECRRPHLEWDGLPVSLPVRVRYSGETLVVLLHGIGCSSESFADAFGAASLRGYSICAFDFPGHGHAASLIPDTDLQRPADFLRLYADLTRQVVRWVKGDGPGINRVLLVGHSMGGAVGVITASDSHDISGLINIDGNLVAEDCGIVSRRMAEQSLDEFLRAGYREFLAELRRSSGKDFKAWAGWCAEASPTALHQAARSLVIWSDSGKLLEKFNKLPARAYLYGAADDRGYIIKQIDRTRITIVGIRDSGHFAMIDNAKDFYRILSALLDGMP
jgi:pimeloyl-ACP methyl ester carboxylesterase